MSDLSMPEKWKDKLWEFFVKYFGREKRFIFLGILLILGGVILKNGISDIDILGFIPLSTTLPSLGVLCILIAIAIMMKDRSNKQELENIQEEYGVNHGRTNSAHKENTQGAVPKNIEESLTKWRYGIHLLDKEEGISRHEYKLATGIGGNGERFIKGTYDDKKLFKTSNNTWIQKEDICTFEVTGHFLRDDDKMFVLITNPENEKDKKGITFIKGKDTWNKQWVGIHFSVGYAPWGNPDEFVSPIVLTKDEISEEAFLLLAEKYKRIFP